MADHPVLFALGVAAVITVGAVIVSGAILCVYSVLTAGDETGRDPRLGRTEPEA